MSDPTKRIRPIVAGVSCTHYKSSRCTLGWFFKVPRKQFIVGRSIDGKIEAVPIVYYEILIAGCNHCIGLENKAKKGDPILQPSPYDGGRVEEDTVGYFEFEVETKYESFSCPVRNSLLKIAKFFLKPISVPSGVSIGHSLPR